MLDISNPGSPNPAENLSAPQLRQDLRSWTRDLAVALGLALVIPQEAFRPLLASLDDPSRFILSGGLSVENVSRANATPASRTRFLSLP